jgi:cytochrome c553
MKKQLILVGVTAAALLFGGCGTDKKVEDRVTEIQSNTPVSQSNATVTTEAPKAAAAPVDGKGMYTSKCAACHGEKGEGKAAYPKLAGLSKDVALTRLKGYVDGTYGKAQKMIMTGQAKGIDDAQKAAVAEYIATLK